MQMKILRSENKKLLLFQEQAIARKDVLKEELRQLQRQVVTISTALAAEEKRADRAEKVTTWRVKPW